MPISRFQDQVMNIFSTEVISSFYQNHYLLFVLSVLVGSFATTWYLVPKIIWVTQKKELTKPVIGRSVHTKPIPTFGGVAFFVTLILAISLIQVLELDSVGNHLIAALTILFMVGIKDDLVVSTARVKLAGQIMAIGFLVFSPGLEIDNLHGFLGFNAIPSWVGMGLGAFVLLAIINSYNLIDGIDGLASVIGIIAGAVYAGIFYLTGQHFYVLVSVILMGMLAGFLRFNYSSGRRKIFMGDSGALVVGLLIGFLSLKVLSFDAQQVALSGYGPQNTLLMVLAILFVPFLDTTRSMILRIMNGKSPFDPDRNHIHHVLLDAGYTHKKATLCLGLMNLSVVSLIYFASAHLNSYGMLALMTGIYAFFFGLFHLIKKQSSRAQEATTQLEEDRQSLESVIGTAGVKVDARVRSLFAERYDSRRKKRKPSSLSEEEHEKELADRELANY